MLVLNADTLNSVFAEPNSVGSEAFSRVLADVAKDQGTDVNGHTMIDRLMSAEYSVIAAQSVDGAVSTADLDAQARIAATLAHGHGAANIGLQQASDAAHNASVATVAGVPRPQPDARDLDDAGLPAFRRGPRAGIDQPVHPAHRAAGQE